MIMEVTIAGKTNHGQGSRDSFGLVESREVYFNLDVNSIRPELQIHVVPLARPVFASV